MSYQALYRTYRPNTFEEVVGQKHIVVTLQNAVKQNKIAHAYLFCGPRGTGKTTVARILAKAVNCENAEKAPCNQCPSCLAINEGSHPDVIEIDGASYNRVDTARELIEKVKYAPLQAKYKVYIIDEVHMLSDSAFNALLKTLEEPPSHAIFILATTEPNKVLPTIISRCQRFDFTKVDEKGIVDRMKEILDKEKVKYENEALELLADLSDGGMRDALSSLDQLLAYAQDSISLEDIYEVYGLSSPNQRYELLSLIGEAKAAEVLNKSRAMANKGTDVRRLTSDLMEMLKECAIYGYTKEKSFLTSLKEEQAKELLQKAGAKKLLQDIDVLSEALQKFSYSVNLQSVLEVALLKMLPEAKTEEEKEEKQPEENTLFETVLSEKTENREETPLKTEEERPEEPAKPAKEPENTGYDREYLLSLLFSANRKKREKIQEKWKELEGYRIDYRYSRYADSLRSSGIGACGEDYMVVFCERSAEADIINSYRREKEFRELTEKVCGEALEVIAVDKACFTDLVNEFRRRQSAQSAEEKKGEEKSVVSNPTENKLASLFGEGNFEVIE